MKSTVGFAQRAGPYLLIELLLPGGTLIALLLFAMRNRSLTLDSMGAKLLGTLAIAQPYDISAVANADAANDSDGLGPLAMLPQAKAG